MQFENKITMGNIIMMIPLLLALAGGYSNLQSEQSRQADRLVMLETNARDRAALSDASRASMEVRVGATEVAIAGQSADLRNIQTGINEIKATLEKLAGKP